MSPNGRRPGRGTGATSRAVETLGTTVPAAGAGDPRMLDAALAYAGRGWRIHPVIPWRWTRPGAGKAPLTPHGMLDATTDPDVIRRWWRRWPDAGIGAVVPGHLVVVDVDPRNGGAESLTQLVEAHGPLPVTLTSWSGRGDGGRHLWFRRPPGRLTGARLPAGIDLKLSTGYVVVPPSRHAATGHPYQWERHPVVDCPPSLAALLEDRPPEPSRRPPGRRITRRPGLSPIEAFLAATSWRDVLASAGWTLVRGDGDEPGSAWRHPTATSAVSATVASDDRLYVYSTSTALAPTETGHPQGHSRWDVWVALAHGGDQGAALHRIRTTGAIT